MGYKKPLQPDDVWLLDREYMAATTLCDFSRLSRTNSLVSRLLHFFRNELLLQALWACLSSITVFMPTLLLQAILQHLVETEETTGNAAWLYVTLMFVSGCTSALADGQMAWLGHKIALRLRSIVIGEVYAKAMLRSLGATRNKDASAALASDATVFSLVTIDSFKIADAGATAHELWASVPVQIIICLGLLYRLLGFSALAGVSMMVLMFPINAAIIDRLGKAQMTVMGLTDLRIRGTTEFLRNIRVIKLFVWEQKFMAQIGEERSTELKALKVRLVLWSFAATIWYVVPLLITFLSFVVYVTIAGNKLLPSVAFTALSLFNLLKAPLDQFVGMLARLQDARVSINRVQEFLFDEETAKYKQIDPGEATTDAIILENATFSWTPKMPGNSQHAPPIALSGITAEFGPGSLNVIAGPVGSGKSALLLALLGELNLLGGKFQGPAGPVAYCAQDAWLLNASIRENILFTEPWEPERYRTVIEACALDPDLLTLDAGDLSLAGDRGIFLSGGQKQRIALARAVYSRCSYLIIDDCLSAVDPHTARWICNQCLNGPLMKDRICVMATHNVALVIPQCAYIVLLDYGRVMSSGRPEEVGVSAILGESSSNHPESTEHVERLQEQADQHPEESKQGQTGQTKNNQTETTAESGTLRRVPWRTISMYMRAMGTWKFWMLFVVFFISQQTLSISAHWWIKRFSSAYSMQPDHSPQGAFADSRAPIATADRGPPQVNTGYYLGIYGLILCLYSIVSLSRMLLASTGSLSASKTVHDTLLMSISHATLSYFDKAPFGRLLNRFSKDIQTCDLEMAPMVLATVHFSFSLISVVAIITVVTPAFLIPGIFITVIYLAIGRLYIDCSRDLKRLEAEGRDPLYQHVSESVLGITTIRAFQKDHYFREQNLGKIDAVNTPFLYLNGVDRWLAFRLSLAGTLVSVLAGCFAVVSRGRIDAGAVGFSLTYAITYSENVLWLIRYYAASEQSFTSVERIHPSEPWPSRGEILFEDYSTTYRSDLPAALKNITFHIGAAEKVGIVGRTGAGKSSLVRSLLRGLAASSGRILIDGVDISGVGLRHLRRGVVVVSQDATLFAATLRSNLDPLGEYSDDEIRDALQLVHLVQTREKDAANTELGPAAHEGVLQKINFEDLSFMLAESGSNISQGQRQLLCLARAILRTPKVLVLDEATASVDYETDLAIQRAIADIGTTTITIVHRLRSVIDYDRILVLDHGELSAFDHPWVLLQQDGPFKDMCRATGNLAMLEGLAKAAWEAKKRL
ncbi:Putative ABC transporter protein [Macrophomina phaseolina MS6]|uniref:Putative ABC transporter protein n=1 Tax=Macrophomina phaseolina (strain MS6) TaxID=1126212 RepID=K2RHN7_MACPH|nr:Putative ABC transporter protein [Macrophomina phaseolina MS6]